MAETAAEIPGSARDNASRKVWRSAPYHLARPPQRRQPCPGSAQLDAPRSQCSSLAAPHPSCGTVSLRLHWLEALLRVVPGLLPPASGTRQHPWHNSSKAQPAARLLLALLRRGSAPSHHYSPSTPAPPPSERCAGSALRECAGCFVCHRLVPLFAEVVVRRCIRGGGRACRLAHRRSWPCSSALTGHAVAWLRIVPPHPPPALRTHPARGVQSLRLLHRTTSGRACPAGAASVHSAPLCRF